MMQPPSKRKPLLTWGPALLALVLFPPLFALRRLGAFDFWWWMSLNAALVMAYTFFADKSYAALIKIDLKNGAARKILLGIFSAVLLYGIFYAGGAVSRILIPFAGSGINSVYAFKEGASTLRIALLMVFLIGPGEEIFWRGFLQRHWEKRFGPAAGYLLAALFYALIHLASGNIMLVLAAGVCALFWGGLYLKYRSVVLLVISHTIWDLMIFLAWTLNT